MVTSSGTQDLVDSVSIPLGVEESGPPIKECYILDGAITPDNVLKFAIGEMESVSITGKKKNGEWYFASSSENPFEIMDALNRFMKVCQTHIDFDPSDEE